MSWRRRVAAAIPDPAKGPIRTAQRSWSRATARLRILPHFLIIGAQRCGTTSLYQYLADHPSVGAPMLGKGAHFFDTHYGEGEAWYRAHFPTRAYQRALERLGRPLLTGEGSPYYVFHPHVPARVEAMLPHVRLVAMLRDPVARAHSHYWHEVARGFEELPFEEALDREPERLGPELERMQADPLYNSFEHQHHSYVSRGLYADQLERWFALFPRAQILVLSSSAFFADPDAQYRRVLDFLGLRPVSLRKYETFNPRTYRPMAEATERRLTDYFAEPNRRLYELLDEDFGWRR